MCARRGVEGDRHVGDHQRMRDEEMASRRLRLLEQGRIACGEEATPGLGQVDDVGGPAARATDEVHRRRDQSASAKP